MGEFDAGRAWLRGADCFPRFVPEGDGTPISSAQVPDDTEVIVAERGGEAIALVMRELSHPHMAQGKLAGEPYLVSF